ncbi:hypothetical protein [Streptomyces sp. DH24]|uniref:hypothetical protein n=1 Tax=Streptomyces sp. DH24 TaxID=3040123 RepID=UPI002443392C|nr:hypothetical protein [Streptomyces sp. DH24]MDG9719129.1 hypothetical protein [Streptomyces sp. DH24]
MSSAPVSSYGFLTVRRRGYRPAQVDAYAAVLSHERDAAWERAARLTVLAREMGAEAEREEAERLDAFETLGAQSLARAERTLAEARQALADEEASAARAQEAARERAEEILAGARARQEHIARETERMLREHGERWDRVRAELDRVHSSLAALTGQTAPE